jgi:hypothetical protein
VATGVEWAIPPAALGNPSGCVEVCALIKLSDAFNAHVANQVLGPLPPEGTTWGRVKAVYR